MGLFVELPHLLSAPQRHSTSANVLPPVVSEMWSKKTNSWIQHLGVSENNGTPKSSILIGFSIINHPFWGTPICGNIHLFVAGFNRLNEFDVICIFCIVPLQNHLICSMLQHNRTWTLKTHLPVLEGVNGQDFFETFRKWWQYQGVLPSLTDSKHTQKLHEENDVCWPPTNQKEAKKTKKTVV